MYMKPLFTDQFLWDAYSLLDGVGDIFAFIVNPHPGKWSRLSGDYNPIFEKYRKEGGIRKFNKLVQYAKTRGYIRVKGLKGNRAIMLTKEGLDRVLRASFKVDQKSKRKDGKWIMVAFDVPQKYKKSRNLLTSTLKNLGYKMFQQSVWVTPYDVSEKTEKSLQFYSLEKFVKVFLIEEM